MRACVRVCMCVCACVCAYVCIFCVWAGSDMHTYDLQANCWFSVELCGMKSSTCLTHLVLISPTRTVFSFGAHDPETGVGPVSSDVYRMSPLITYVSFAALRNQVESMSEVINLSFDSQSEGVGRAIRKVDALMKRLETVEKEIEGLRTANEYLTRQLEAVQGSSYPKRVDREGTHQRMRACMHAAVTEMNTHRIVDFSVDARIIGPSPSLAIALR